MRRPRAMVLDEVWRGLEGVQALSGPQGGPLRRTVKLILDPLVIRPVQYPNCAGAILSADGATLLAARIHAHADALRAAAAWFTLLKQVRRELRITEGNAQDLYFQRCFELAATRGHPDPQRDRLRAEAVLREIHGFAAGRTTQALKEHLTDPARAVELNRLLDTAWGRRPVSHSSGERTVAAARSAELRKLLESAVATRTTADVGPGRECLRGLIAANAGVHSGIALWWGSADGIPLAGSGSDVYANGRRNGDSASAAAPVQRSGVRESGVRVAKVQPAPADSAGRYDANLLGLTEHPVPCRPALGDSASTADLGLPFDRSVYERVFTVLQVSTERADLPPISELVTKEIARSCAPWALLDESLRVTAAAGVELALGLAPITGSPGRAAPADGTAETAAHRLINSRWQREAYVLQARRMVIHPVSGEHNPLAAIAADLRRPWRPYLRRLWVRLHGRDVRDLTVSEPDELWDLLDGIARSVVLDHRARVRKVLSAQAAGNEPAVTESRAV